VYDYDIAGPSVLRSSSRCWRIRPRRVRVAPEWRADDDARADLAGAPEGCGEGRSRRAFYGYGSYELSMDPWFRRCGSLLDRGFVFAVAHIRGGECGRSWYDDGKLMHKRNTFTDFIAARVSPATSSTRHPHGCRHGGSAGGCSWVRPEHGTPPIQPYSLRFRSWMRQPSSIRRCR
jgi:oligopeptidase B